MPPWSCSGRYLSRAFALARPRYEAIQKQLGPLLFLTTFELRGAATLAPMGYADEMRFRDCPWCGLRDAQMNLMSPDMRANGPSGMYRTYSMLSCPRCAGVTLVETNHAGVVTTEVRDVWPKGDEHSTPAHLPDDVKGFYLDAKRVLDVGVPDAAAVQLRRTLEAAAAHHGIDSGPLVQRIKKLIDAGLVTTEFGNVLDHIRRIGNVGAHATDERLSDESVRRAYRFTTQVLVNLFEIPAELKALTESVEDEEPTTAEEPATA